MIGATQFSNSNLVMYEEFSVAITQLLMVIYEVFF